MFRKQAIIKAVLLTAVVLVTAGCQHTRAYEHGWNRTGLTASVVADAPGPIRIASIEQLQRIGTHPSYPLDGYYVLTRHIDAEHTRHWNDGAGFQPIGICPETGETLQFRGWFDGRGYAVRDLWIHRPDESRVGLFGSLARTAVVVNLALERGAVAGEHYVGALAGESFAGAVAVCRSSVHVTGTSRVGGLIGINRGAVEACYATGNVQGDEVVGGLVGRNFTGTVTECYATGPVFGETLAGGLIGANGEGSVLRSFWSVDTSGQPHSQGGTGVTLPEMRRRATFAAADWDFDTLWYLIPGYSYPRFQLQR